MRLQKMTTKIQKRLKKRTTKSQQKGNYKSYKNKAPEEKVPKNATKTRQ